MPDFATGRLLIATPRLQDPNFARTVIYVGMHDENGAFGLILNRPLEVPIAGHLPDWDSVASAPAVLFQGGPVETSSVVALARPLDEALPGWTEMAGGAGLVDLRIPAGELAPSVAHLRMFLGYAGWGAGQLEQEIAEEAWFVVGIEREDLFTDDPSRLRRRVLHRQGGKLAMFTYFPEDPRLN